MKTFSKPLTAAEEKIYLQRYQEGDLEAKNILIERNLRLVAHIVKKYQGSDEELDDLISIGTIGLIKAVSTFNAAKSARLSTYAARCIDNELLMMFRARKKRSREVSLYDPIGTDKEGNEISLLDIIESPPVDIVEEYSTRERYLPSDGLYPGCPLSQGISGDLSPVRSRRCAGTDPERDRLCPEDQPLLCVADRKKRSSETAGDLRTGTG